MHSLIKFLEKYVENDGHSLFDPFYLDGSGDFSEECADTMITEALIGWSEGAINKSDRLNAAKYLKRFNSDENYKKAAIQCFIEEAKEAYECYVREI